MPSFSVEGQQENFAQFIVSQGARLVDDQDPKTPKIYDEVDSCHQIFNNHILAIKLRRGFHIIGFDQSTLVGPRVRLRYFHNK
jgi:hypothetical protein